MQTLEFIQSFSNPFLDNFFVAITTLGEESIYIFLLTLIYWCIDKKYGYQLSFTILFSSVANGVIKSIFRSPRPLDVEHLRHLRVETATGHSFPSGHTQTTAAFYGFIMKKYNKIWLYIVCSIIIFLVAVSRLYLGVHWPKDVLVGALLGIAIAFLFEYLFRQPKSIGQKYILMVIFIPFTLCLLIFNDSADLYKSCGLFFGFLLGYSIEDKYIQFNPKTQLPKQIIKYIFGLSVAIILKSLLKSMLPKTLISDLVRYFILGTWITLIAPYIFKSLHLSGYKNKKI